jgi:hypothetical protein
LEPAAWPAGYPGMKHALTIVALATLMLAGTAIAQSPTLPDKQSPAPATVPKNAPIPQRSIKITAEQSYVIKENVKDVRPAQPAGGSAVEIGGKAPASIELHDFPSIVTEKVSAVKTYKFFIADNQVVVVDPKDNTIADILK